MDRAQLATYIWVRSLLSLLVIAALLILLAGTWRYWEAWLYLGIIFIPAIFIIGYFLLHDPSILQRRIAVGERDPWQNLVLVLFILCYVGIFVLAGLDHRYGWSVVPPLLVIAADVVALAGYLFVFRVLQVNSYAASQIQVEAGQSVISTGPYALVRHPMYLGTLLMLIFTPLALGSYWALLPVIPIPFLLAARLLYEESMLTCELQGYDEYRQKVKWRLVPGIW